MTNKNSQENYDMLLEVNNLKTYFKTDAGIVKAVDGISFKLGKGETLGIVGESGSGKSVTNLSIMRLIPSPPGKIVDGEVIFEGRDILQLPESALRNIRGNEISMIFQDPMTSLKSLPEDIHTDDRDDQTTPGHLQEGCPAKIGRHAQIGGNSCRGGKDSQLSPSIFRWNATEGNDRHGLEL